MRRRLALGAGLAVLLALLPAASAGARGLGLGVMDFAPFEGPESAVWLARAQALGAGYVRLTGRWNEIAPAARAGLREPSDPADPGYRWDRLDGSVRAAAAQNLRILLTIHRAPAWAEGSGRAANARPGTWRPDPAAFADFMAAAARRYSGSFPDPLRPGATLPRIRYWQPWNEPNLPTYLNPQWTGPRQRPQRASPSWYRGMLNAAYARVKQVHGDNVVIAAGTAPYGDPPIVRNRMTPVSFMRALLCLRGPALKRVPCPAPAHFDVIDHHPYATGSPTQHALLPENVAIPDLGKLTHVLHAAERAHTIRPAGAKRVWITEFSWDSRPPDPQGVPEARRTRWLQDGLYSLWRQGASTIFWFLLRDQPPVPAYNATYQSGLYRLDGTAKPAAAAFRFPLVARLSRGRAMVWGRSPVPGDVTIERRGATGWRPIASLRASGGVFQGRVRAPRGAALRARAGADASLTRTVN
jgi:hypothetical protein